MSKLREPLTALAKRIVEDTEAEACMRLASQVFLVAQKCNDVLGDIETETQAQMQEEDCLLLLTKMQAIEKALDAYKLLKQEILSRISVSDVTFNKIMRGLR